MSLNGYKRKDALDFIDFLRLNGFILTELDDVHGWSVNYKGTPAICVYFDVAGFEFVIDVCTRDFNSDGLLDNELKEFTWTHTCICPQGCDGTTICDRSQKNIKIFGKEYENICITPLQFFNPDVKDFTQVKKLILMLKQNIDDKHTK